MILFSYWNLFIWCCHYYYLFSSVCERNDVCVYVNVYIQPSYCNRIKIRGFIGGKPPWYWVLANPARARRARKPAGVRHYNPRSNPSKSTKLSLHFLAFSIYLFSALLNSLYIYIKLPHTFRFVTLCTLMCCLPMLKLQLIYIYVVHVFLDIQTKPLNDVDINATVTSEKKK